MSIQHMHMPPPPPFSFQQDNQKKMPWQRRGILGWWMNLTAPPRPEIEDLSNLRTRERVRKSETISLTAIGVFIFLLALVSNSLSDPSTAVAVITMGIAMIGALVFNRFGRINTAAYIIVIFMMIVIMISLIGAKGGLRLIWFVTFDLFTIPVMLCPLIINRWSAIMFTIIAVGFVLLYYTYEPHALINGLGAHNFDELLYEVQQPYFSWYALINRNVLLIGFAGFFSFVGASAYEWALTVGEQARNEASIATLVAQYKQQSEQVLSAFIQEVTAAFAALDNGQLVLLKDREDLLHEAVLFLNHLLRKLAQRQQERVNLRGMTLEIQRLLEVVYEVRKGSLSVTSLNPKSFRSSYQEINLAAQHFYELLLATQPSPNA
jgi:hypothetical protein